MAVRGLFGIRKPAWISMLMAVGCCEAEGLATADNRCRIMAGWKSTLVSSLDLRILFVIPGQKPILSLFASVVEIV